MKPHAASLMRWFGVSAAIAIIWILVSHLIVNPLIVKAYHGQSNAFFNQIIEGHEQHGVEHYLQEWSSLTRLTIIAVFASAFAFYLAGVSRASHRIPFLDNLADRDTLSVKQSIMFVLVTLLMAGGFSILCSLLATSLGSESGAFIRMVAWEGGILQLTTFAILALGTAFAVDTARHHEPSRRVFLLVSLLMLLYTARELDVGVMLRLGRPTDKWIPFFLGPSSIPAKIFFSLLIVTTGLAVIALIWRKSIIRALAQREAWAIYGFVWSMMLASSQLFIDKAPVGIELKYYSFEEPFEMFTSAVCFLSVYSLAYRERCRADEATGST